MHAKVVCHEVRSYRPRPPPHFDAVARRAHEARLAMIDSLVHPTPEGVLYPECAPRASGMLALDGRHAMHWEECGNASGVLQSTMSIRAAPAMRPSSCQSGRRSRPRCSVGRYCIPGCRCAPGPRAGLRRRIESRSGISFVFPGVVVVMPGFIFSSFHPRSRTSIMVQMLMIF